MHCVKESVQVYITEIHALHLVRWG